MTSTVSEVKSSIAPQIKTARRFFGVSDLYVLGFVFAGFVGTGSLAVNPLIAAPFLALGGYLGYVYYTKRGVAVAAAQVASNAWVAHYPSGDLHTPAGEKVSVVKFDPDAFFVEVQFEDGQKVRCKPDDLKTSDGVRLKSPTPDFASAGVLWRWSECRWKTDAGKIGIAREVGSYSVSADATGTRILLKFEDGTSDRVDVCQLTPVAYATAAS